MNLNLEHVLTIAWMPSKVKCRMEERSYRTFNKFTLVVFFCIICNALSLQSKHYIYSCVLFRMMELLVFLCLLILALLLCWMLVAALTVCLLLGTVMALQMYRAPLQQNDANRYHILR